VNTKTVIKRLPLCLLLARNRISLVPPATRFAFARLLSPAFPEQHRLVVLFQLGAERLFFTADTREAGLTVRQTHPHQLS
jgi:hypothetical protein